MDYAATINPNQSALVFLGYDEQAVNFGLGALSLCLVGFYYAIEPYLDFNTNNGAGPASDDTIEVVFDVEEYPRNGFDSEKYIMILYIMTFGTHYTRKYYRKYIIYKKTR